MNQTLNNFHNNILEYNNAKYQGNVKAFSRENNGILFWDNGHIYLGQWKKNKIHGKGLFVFPNGSYLYSTFNEDQLNGLTLMKLVSGHLMIGNWSHNRKLGLFLYFDKDKNLWLLCEHKEKHKNPQIICEEINSGKEIFPKFLDEFPALKQLMQENIFQLLNDDLKGRDPNLVYIRIKDNIE